MTAMAGQAMRPVMALKRITAVVVLASLAACAVAPGPRPEGVAGASVSPTLPPLRLDPALLQNEFALNQRLSVFPLDGPDAAPQVVDAQLELDRQGLRLAAFAAGQRVLTLAWDGRALAEQRHPRLPQEVDTARMLRDMTLVYWPAQALSEALSAPWRLEAFGQRRVLSAAGTPVLMWEVQGALASHSRIELTNLRERYRLLIESHPLEDTP